VKIEPSCVVKLEKRNFRELRRGYRAVTKRLPCRNFRLRLYVVEQKAWNENRKYRGSGGVAGPFAESKFS
jgi:hypothetical protein